MALQSAVAWPHGGYSKVLACPQVRKKQKSRGSWMHLCSFSAHLQAVGPSTSKRGQPSSTFTLSRPALRVPVAPVLSSMDRSGRENGPILSEARFPGLPLHLWRSSWDLISPHGSRGLHPATVQLEEFTTHCLTRQVIKQERFCRAMP